MFQEAMGQVKAPTQEPPKMASSPEGANLARPEIPLHLVEHATQEVGVQGTDADRVDKSTHMEAPTLVASVDASTAPEDSPTTADASVSTPSECWFKSSRMLKLPISLDNIQVTESPPGCLI